MAEKNSSFYTYRYLVTRASDQASLFSELYNPFNKSKEELMTETVRDLAIRNKTEWIKGNRRFLFYSIQERGNIFIFKFAKETKDNIYVEGDEDIEMQPITNAKFVYVIIDTKHQIILIERNASVYKDIETSVNYLTEFFRDRMKIFGYVVNIYPLVYKKLFWHYVESAEEIYELTLEMNAPNMAFFGNEDTRDVLAEIRKITNNEVLDISFKNREGHLKVAREALGGYIDYIREVGGKYLLKFKRDGVMEIKSSTQDTAKIHIETKKNRKIFRCRNR